MTGNGETGEVCPACQGSGKTKRFRKTPLIVALAALPFILLGVVLTHYSERDPETGQLLGGLFSACEALIAILVFAVASWAFFGRGTCFECGGRGTTGGPSDGVPFLFREDRYRLQRGCCRHCGYNLAGNTSGVCPECGTDVLKV